MKKFLRIALAVALIVMSLTSVMGTVVAADELTAETAVAAIGTTYYASLDEAVAAAQDGDTVTVLKDTTMGEIIITGKKITVKGEGTTKPVITPGAAKPSFWLKGSAELTLQNLKFADFAGKNVVKYGWTDTAADIYKITVDNCEVAFSASGAIYGYQCIRTEVVVTNSTFEAIDGQASRSVLNPSIAPSDATYTKFENVTLVGCGQNVNTSAQGTIKDISELPDPNATESAVSDADAIAKGAVARIGETTSGKFDEVYFKNLGLAVAFAKDGDTIYVLANIEGFESATVTDKTIKVVGVEKYTITPGNTKIAFAVNGPSGLTLENLKFTGYTGKNVVILNHARGSSESSYTLNLKNVEMGFQASGAIYGYEMTKAEIYIEDCTFNAGAAGNCIINFTSSVCYQEAIMTIKGVTLNENCGYLNAQAENVKLVKVYANDAEAVADGMRIRVGDTEGGTAYYTAISAAAFKEIAAGTKFTVFCTCGAKQELTTISCTTKVTCTCGLEIEGLIEHDFTEATCASKSSCTICQLEVGEPLEHVYSKATCSEKSKCVYCGLETGDLADHKDKNGNGKCDVCNAEMPAETTPAENSDTANAGDDAEKKGCGGTVTVAGLALVAALGSCAIFVEKKRR